MVGILASFWDGLFPGAMLVLGTVLFKKICPLLLAYVLAKEPFGFPQFPLMSYLRKVKIKQILKQRIWNHSLHCILEAFQCQPWGCKKWYRLIQFRFQTLLNIMTNDMQWFCVSVSVQYLSISLLGAQANPQKNKQEQNQFFLGKVFTSSI